MRLRSTLHTCNKFNAESIYCNTTLCLQSICDTILPKSTMRKSNNGLAPIYLSELLRYSNSSRLLRSSSQNFLAVPRSRLKTYGDRAFSVIAPKLWNQLPPELRDVICVDQFRTHLKTYLLAYDVSF